LRSVMQIKESSSFLCGRECSGDRRARLRRHDEGMIAEWRADQNLTADDTDQTDFH
jgi:hypothetical protein